MGAAAEIWDGRISCCSLVGRPRNSSETLAPKGTTEGKNVGKMRGKRGKRRWEWEAPMESGKWGFLAALLSRPWPRQGMLVEIFAWYSRSLRFTGQEFLPLNNF